MSSAPDATYPTLSLGPGVGVHSSRLDYDPDSPPIAPPKVVSLAQALAFHAADRPHAVGIYFLDLEERLDALTYGELYCSAQKVAAKLRAHGVSRGERVVLTMDTGREYVSCLFACVLLGAVPVPLYPPADVRLIGPWRQTVERVMRDARCRVIMTERRLEAPAVAVADCISGGLALVDCASQSAGDPDENIVPRSASDNELAFIQYTSGTTALPKGVKISHRALLTNIGCIATKTTFRRDDMIVCWLPLYHDMGLVSCVLAPIWSGVPVVLMTPPLFLFRPRRWLWAFHHFRGTHSAAPSFAYGLCAEKIHDDELEGLDLRSWRVSCNGAETIAPTVMERFTTRFSRYGFSPATMCPVYGMAETTLAATFPEIEALPRVETFERTTLQKQGRAVSADAQHPDGLALVSTGRPFAEHALAIVDGDGAQLAERRRGEIVLRGPSLFAGYVGGVDATAVRDGWFHTGDLGFVADGELFVCGRIKDLIIKAGRNLHPFDIEQAAEAVGGVRVGNVAAFGVNEGGTDDLIIALESRLSDMAALRRIEREVEQAIFERVGVRAKEILIFPPMTLPKTSSGKLSRAKVRQMYLGDGIVPRGRRGTTLSAAMELGNVYLRNATARLRKAPMIGRLVERLLPRKR